MINFKPLGNRILIKKTESSNTTSSGIIIPDDLKEKPTTGTVIAVSSRIDYLKIDSLVLFGKYDGNEVTIENEKYIILEVDEVLGVFG